MKKIALPIVLLAAAVAIGTFGAEAVSADSQEWLHQSIASRLAERFNLNESEVEAVFAEARGEHHQAMLVSLEARLDALVEQGQLTAEQKALLLAKHEDMAELMDEFAQMSPEERRAAIQAHHDDIEAWAEENGLDLSELGFAAMKHHGGHGMGHGH
jgi:Skp family chaperone for outer membrane proteins